jgi:hypothetical protein
MSAHMLYVPTQTENGAIIRVHTTDHLDSGALFSRDDRYRYALWRVWARRDDTANRRTLAVVGLNPSTADEQKNDPTVERCMRRADQYGYDALLMLNLFAFRATDPQAMKAADDPVGPWNDETLDWALSATHISAFLVGWGAHGTFNDSGSRFVNKARKHRRELLCLGTTKGGEPAHPLYLSYDRQPTPYKGRLP